jgi:hypothetical protein
VDGTSEVVYIVSGIGVDQVVIQPNHPLLSHQKSLENTNRHNYSVAMGLYTKLADFIDEVDIIIAGGTSA